MLLRQAEGKFYAKPESSWWRRILWRLGFDPLTVYERLRQVNIERQYWSKAAGS